MPPLRWPRQQVTMPRYAEIEPISSSDYRDIALIFHAASHAGSGIYEPSLIVFSLPRQAITPLAD